MKENYFMKINYYIYYLFFNLYFSLASETVVNEKIAVLDDVLSLCVVNPANQIENQTQDIITSNQYVLSHNVLDKEIHDDDLLNESSFLNNELIDPNTIKEIDSVEIPPTEISMTSNFIDENQIELVDEGESESLFINNTLLDNDGDKEQNDLIMMPISNFDESHLEQNDSGILPLVIDNGVFNNYEMKETEYKDPLIYVENKIYYKKDSLKGRVKGINRTCHRIFKKM